MYRPPMLVKGVEMKFRIWTINKMVTPEEMNARGNTYAYFLNQRGGVFGVDLSCMKWDGNLHLKSCQIMPEVGRTDAMGRSTYEGDVVRVHTAKGVFYGLVTYSREQAAYVVELTTGGNVPLYSNPVYEIVGHRFQNDAYKLLPEWAKLRA